MNEELIRQCARETVGEFDWFDHDTAEETATKAIRLYHARHVAPLVEAVEKARVQISDGLCYFTAEAKPAQLKDADKTLEAALAPFQQEGRSQ